MAAINDFSSGNINVSSRTSVSYKADLADGSTLVVKRLSACGFAEKQFRSEMNRLGELRHPNLVPLLGYCVVEDERVNPLEMILLNTRESSYLNPNFFNFLWFSSYDFSLRRRWKNPFANITCSSLVQGLKPKQKLKPKPIREPNLVPKDPVLNDTYMSKSSVVICSHIEKFMLCNRLREMFEQFDYLEIRGSVRAEISTYYALVEACIRLKSIRCVLQLSTTMFYRYN